MAEAEKTTTGPIILDARELRDYLAGCCAFSGAAYADIPSRMHATLRWYGNAVAQDLAFIPFNVFFDLGHLFLDGHVFPFAGPSEYDNWPERERGMRAEYENRFLNRILANPAFPRLRTLLDSAGDVNAVISRAMEIILAPLKSRRGEFPADKLITIVPTLLRSADFGAGPDVPESRRKIDQLIKARTGLADFILTSQRKFVETAPGLLPAGNIFTEIDFHELENFDVYERTDARMRARAVKELERDFGDFNREIFDRVREEEAAVTEFEDAGFYPVGGFAEITNRRGSIENLVKSELIYAGEKVSGVDLFDLRFTESELLYYNRDEGRLMRRRRRINFILDLSSDMRIAPRSGEGQIWTLVCALVIRLARDLTELFERDAVSFRLIIVAPDFPEEILNECSLLNILLGKEIALGRANVTREKSLDLSGLDEHEWKPYAVVITTSTAAPETIHYGDFPLDRRNLSTFWLQVGREFAPPHGAPAFHVTYDFPLRPQFTEVRDELLRAIAAVK